MTVAQLRVIVDDEISPDESLLTHLERDKRLGVRRLVSRNQRRRQAKKSQRQRASHLRALDEGYWSNKIEKLVGVDEVGRGCIAGPVVAAAVALPPGFELDELDDSKNLNPLQRKYCSEVIHECALAIGIGYVNADQIDELNILQAALLAMRKAVRKLGLAPEKILIDGMDLPETGFEEEAVVHGDSRSISIAAASVVAKVHRDTVMAQFATKYPQYGFEENKGYGTAAHVEALRKNGPTILHRRSFAPVSTWQSTG